jgi:hypothetical protein
MSSRGSRGREKLNAKKVEAETKAGRYGDGPMMFISLPEVGEAERLSKAECIAAGRYLRVNETKITSPKDLMLLHRAIAAGAA